MENDDKKPQHHSNDDGSKIEIKKTSKKKPQHKNKVETKRKELKDTKFGLNNQVICV